MYASTWIKTSLNGMAKVVFIPKVGKKDTTHPNSQRPISFNSFFFLKIMAGYR